MIHVLFSWWLVEDAVDTRSRLQLLTVSAVTNDESWAHYVARREAENGGFAGRTCLFWNRKLNVVVFVVNYSIVVFFRVEICVFLSVQYFEIVFLVNLLSCKKV